MRLSSAAELVGDSKEPRTHRVGFYEIREIARAWREIRKGDVKTAERRIFDVLESIEPRWPNL